VVWSCFTHRFEWRVEAPGTGWSGWFGSARGLWGLVAHLGCVTDELSASWGLEPLLGVAELAGYLGVQVSTVYEWRAHGSGPVAHRFGKHLKFALSDVRTWVEAHRETAPGSGHQGKSAPCVSLERRRSAGGVFGAGAGRAAMPRGGGGR
jgi:excisionase family DNA binding protein